MKVSCAYNRLFTVDQTDQILVMDFLEYGFYLVVCFGVDRRRIYSYRDSQSTYQNQTMGQAKRRI